jgi:hypothetical protein
MHAGALAFRNNYAINHNVTGMPTGDFSVGFWARTPAIDELKMPGANQAELFSYATHLSASGAHGNSLDTPSPAHHTNACLYSESPGKVSLDILSCRRQSKPGIRG